MATKKATKTKKTAKPQDEASVIEQATQELLSLLGLSATVSVDLSEDVANVTLDTEDGGLIIGYHGESLEALQLVLALLISKKLDKFVRVSLEIGDYKKNRTDYLQNLVAQTKDQVLSSGKEVMLPNLKSWERRIVHTFIQEDPDVTSESMGEGRDRVLVVKPR